MSNTVSFAGNLTGDPELAYTRGGGKPYVTFRVVVNHRFQNAQGEWQEAEPTPHDVRVYGASTTNVADSFGTGDGVTVHGRLKTEGWTDQETGEKRTRRVVEVNDYLGFVGGWVTRWTAVRTESTHRSSSTPQPV